MGVNIEALAKKKPLAQTTQEVLTGAPEGTRTPDLLVRSQSLYPAELQAHNLFSPITIAKFARKVKGFFTVLQKSAKKRKVIFLKYFCKKGIDLGRKDVIY